MTRKKLKTISRLRSYGKYCQVCSEWADLFETMDISWVFCPELYRGNGNTADFYLPEQGIYFFVDVERPCCPAGDYIDELVKRGETIVIGGKNGEFRICEHGEWSTSVEAWLCLCSECGKRFFINSTGSYECRICGAYDGDHHIVGAYAGDTNLFDFVR